MMRKITSCFTVDENCINKVHKATVMGITALEGKWEEFLGLPLGFTA